MKTVFRSLSVLILTLFAIQSQADQYSCAKMVYKDGWLTKYEHLGNTWGANTKKHGAVSSSAGATVEKTTSSVDPGVLTGNAMSSIQYSSSWGECSMLEYHITQQFRQDYIEQNMADIKRQVVQGQGHHIDSLAYLSGCKNIDRAEWTQGLQSKTSEFYDIKSAKKFSNEIDSFINSKSTLKANCGV